MRLTYRDLSKRDCFRRRLNESIRATHTPRTRLDPSMPAWACECGDEGCTEAVNLTVQEYDAIRANPARFLIAPCVEHVAHGVGHVAERHDRYWVVERRAP